MHPSAPRKLLRRITLVLLLVAGASIVSKLAVCRWAFGFSLEALAKQLLFSVAFFFPFVVGIAGYARWRLGKLAALCRALHEGTATDQQRQDPEIQRLALTFPISFGLLGLGLMLLGVTAKVLFDTLVLELPTAVALGLALTMSALGIAMATLFYMVARRWMHPVVAAFGHKEVPPGPRVSLVPKITFTLWAAALATVVPPAVVHLARVESEGRAAASRNQRQLLDTLSLGSRWQTTEGLQQLIATPPLRDARLRLTGTSRATSATLAPRHGGLFVAADAHQTRYRMPWALAILGLALLALGAVIGRNLGRAVVADMLLVTVSVRHLLHTSSDGQRPLRARAPQLREPDALVNTLNALLLRIAELNVSHFVTIERFIDTDRVKTQFLANMSHDLRGPLSSTLGFSQLLLRGAEGELTAGQRAALETIYRSARQLLHLINEVLDFAKLEAGKLVAHHEEVLVTSLFASALKEARERGYLGEVEVETELQPGLPPLWADGQRLQEALIYVLRFASRVTESGKVRVQCRLRRADDTHAQQRLEIVFEDDSDGIPDELLLKVFDGFRRYPGHPGLGLGLPLARAFIEMHDGQLQVERTKRGNRFVATLPAMARRVERKKTPTP